MAADVALNTHFFGRRTILRIGRAHLGRWGSPIIFLGPIRCIPLLCACFARCLQTSCFQRRKAGHVQQNTLTKTLVDLLYQSLETEQGGIKVYETAITCALNGDLRKEWQEYLEETRHHEDVLLGVFEQLALDPQVRPPSRDIVGGIGDQLVTAMKQARANGTPEQAELVACEAVVLAETKDHSNWDLLDHVAKHDKGPHVSVLKAAVEEVEEDEDHHLYHTKGWCRELWVQTLGFPAVLPPPEEIKQVETAIGAARAEQSRDDMLKVHAKKVRIQ